MKIWMVFDCPQFYPSGGARDFLAASLKSEEEALKRARKERKKRRVAQGLDPKIDEWDWETSVFDTDTLEFQ